MRIKDKEGWKFFKFIFNKKIRIGLWIIMIGIFFLTGILLGLIFSGFFGTFDEPSQKALEIVHSTGLYKKINLGNIKNTVRGIIDENIKIPLNYIRGQFSNPEKIYIDIGFKEYQQIKYKRQRALEIGIISASPDDCVPATIRYKDKEVKVKLRLKGNQIDHLHGDKWSLRIKIEGNDTLFGTKTFSIQNPRTRAYLTEFIYHKALEREDVLTLRYEFIEVYINGENMGIYLFEEFYEKELIEYNNLREGVIIKFSDNWLYEELSRGKYCVLDPLNTNFLYLNIIETFNNNRILKNPELSAQFKRARNLLELFRQGKLKTSEVFDADKLAKFFAINALMGAEHASRVGNLRFYYSPLTSKLEPIGSQAAGGLLSYEVMELYLPDCLSNDDSCLKKPGSFYNSIFRDKIFFTKYMGELEKVSNKSYLDDLFLELDEDIKKNIDIIHKDKPTYHFNKEIYYENQKRMERFIKGYSLTV